MITEQIFRQCILQKYNCQHDFVYAFQSPWHGNMFCDERIVMSLGGGRPSHVSLLQRYSPVLMFCSPDSKVIKMRWQISPDISTLVKYFRTEKFCKTQPVTWWSCQSDGDIPLICHLSSQWENVAMYRCSEDRIFCDWNPPRKGESHR